MTPYAYFLQAIVGFLGVVAGTAVSWGYMKARVTGLYEWREEHLREHENLNRTVTRHGEKIAKLEERSRAAGFNG